uniref:MICAL-like 1a n=1 Tax=Neogobius melanostomus TaxID=47308 RepID=A0A8C6SEP4_9GOBI
MGSLKALQEWCRIQCEDHHDVDIKDMSSSFRDGLAFCALIHRYRPDLIDFSSLSKENVYENNRLAFEVAETQLGIPALLDPEDMVSMKVPDRLSVITYVSQYYNFFNNKSQVNTIIEPYPQILTPCLISPSPIAFHFPSLPTPRLSSLGRPHQQTGAEAKRSTLSSTCSICNKHVHLVQRFLVDGKLFHRNCFRCTECHSTLLPGSYKLQSSSGSLVCTHHIARHALSSQNGRPDLSKKPELSKKPVIVESARIGRSPVPYASSVPSKTEETENLSSNDITSKDAIIATPVVANEADSIEKASDNDITTKDAIIATPVVANEADSIDEASDSGARSSTPPNPFDESDEEEEEEEGVKEEQTEGPAGLKVNGDVPSELVCQSESVSRPVPAPRRVSEPTLPPRPAPRVQSDQYIPVEDIHGEMSQLEKQLDELEHRGVELERKLRDNPNDEDEERLLVDWFTLIHEKHLLVRREAELVYTAKQQNLEERQADVEYELRCLLNKPEKDWTEEDKSREQELMAELVTIIEQRNQIINNMDQDRQREEEEDKLMEAMLKKKGSVTLLFLTSESIVIDIINCKSMTQTKISSCYVFLSADFSKEPNTEHHKKKGTKFKSMKVFKRLSHKVDHGKSPSPRKEQS